MIKEPDLTKIIIERLSPYFELYPELKGEFIHWNQSRNVYLDIGCFPKQAAIDLGFPKYFFGIEVKCINLDTKTGYEFEKTWNLISQCLSYKYAKFGNARMEPAFILIADNLNVDNYKKEFEHEKFVDFIRHTVAIRNFGIQQNIGRLTIIDDEISFKMHGSFWHNKYGFRNKQFLDFYSGNRDMKNKFKKVLTPYEYK